MNILTFDIEEWFHILDNPLTQSESHWEGKEVRIHKNMSLIHDLLDKHKQKATFFCLGWVARKYPELIKEIYERGHEIGTHSDLHQLAYDQTQQVFEEDLKRSIGALENVIQQKIKMYRAPGFSVVESNKWVFESLYKAGIEIDASVFPAPRAHGGLASFGHAEPCYIDSNGIKLKEFPINLLDLKISKLIFSGGGYFRLIPKAILDRLFSGSDYVMTYFHPRDFDAGQPMVPGLNFIRKFKSYYGIKGALGKLDFLLGQHKFIDIGRADAQTDWNKAKTVKI
jgi:peptidoglycan-N-acetylglucosamine deacetylase